MTGISNLTSKILLPLMYHNQNQNQNRFCGHMTTRRLQRSVFLAA